MNDASIANGFPGASEADWRAEVQRTIKGGQFETLTTTTIDGIEIAAAYGQAKLSPCILGLPAAPPAIAPLVAESDPGKANTAILSELEGGATGIVLQLAAAGQYGLPPLPEMLQAAMANVNTESIDLALSPGSLSAGELIECVEKSDVLGPTRGFSLNADPVGAAIAAGGRPQGVEVEALARFAGASSTPVQRRIFCASGLPAHESGASEAVELGAMLASGVAYLRTLETAGISAEDGAGRINIELAVNSEIFLSTAKLRAARLLWNRVLELSNAAGEPAHISARTSARMMVETDAHTNLLRTTSAALAASLGGANSLTVLPFTHALGKPDSFSRRIARNTAIVLAEESHMGAVGDPARGSGAMEHFTHAMAEKAWDIFRGMEAEGGVLSSSGLNVLKRAISQTAAARDRYIENGDRVRIGVNAFLNSAEVKPKVEAWPL